MAGAARAPCAALRIAGTAVLVVGRAVLRAAARRPLRRVPAGRRAPRRHRRAAVRSASASRSRSMRSSPAGTAGIRSCPSRGFRVRDRAGVRTTPLLELPRVDLIVAWTSLPLLDLRLQASWSIEGPRLSVRRDMQGRFHIAGIELEPDDAGATIRRSPTWLLRQRADRRPRRAGHLGRRAAQRAAARARPRAVPPRAEPRPSSLRPDRRAAGRAGVADRRARRRDRRRSLSDWHKTQGHAATCASTTPTSRRGASGCRLPLPIESARARCASGSISPTAQPRDVVADLELADVRRDAGRSAAAADAARILAGALQWQTAPARADDGYSAGPVVHDAGRQRRMRRPISTCAMTLAKRRGCAAASSRSRASSSRRWPRSRRICRFPQALRARPRALRAARHARNGARARGRVRPMRRGVRGERDVRAAVGVARTTRCPASSGCRGSVRRRTKARAR